MPRVQGDREAGIVSRPEMHVMTSARAVRRTRGVTGGREHHVQWGRCGLWGRGMWDPCSLWGLGNKAGLKWPDRARGMGVGQEGARMQGAHGDHKDHGDEGGGGRGGRDGHSGWGRGPERRSRQMGALGGGLQELWRSQGVSEWRSSGHVRGPTGP